MTALYKMGCSSSALNKAGDSSRFGSGGKQGTYTAPMQGILRAGCPQIQRVRPWPSLAIGVGRGESSFPEKERANGRVFQTT